MDVSIIIVNWNTAQITCDCLTSVYEQTKGIDFEVILIDNASSDNSVQMIKDQFPQVILIENTENKGFAAANNQGIAIAKGKYILLLNSDTIILENAIQKTINFAQNHPDSAVIGCKVLNPDKTLQPTCFKFPSILNMFLSSTYLYKSFPKSRFFGREKMTWWQRDTDMDVDVVTGCYMLVSNEAIKQVGIMDERFFVYGEETDWCWRFKQAGWKVTFTPDAQIIHLGGQSTKKISIAMTLQLRGSVLQFIEKHKPKYQYLMACFLVWLFCIVRIPVWLICFALKRKDRKYNWLRAKTYLLGSWRIMTQGPKALTFKKTN